MRGSPFRWRERSGVPKKIAGHNRACPRSPPQVPGVPPVRFPEACEALFTGRASTRPASARMRSAAPGTVFCPSKAHPFWGRPRSRPEHPGWIKKRAGRQGWHRGIRWLGVACGGRLEGLCRLTPYDDPRGPHAANPAESPGCEPFWLASSRKKEKGAGGSRTHDGGFAIRCLSHLATAPRAYDRNATAGWATRSSCVC